MPTVPKNGFANLIFYFLSTNFRKKIFFVSSFKIICWSKRNIKLSVAKYWLWNIILTLGEIRASRG